MGFLISFIDTSCEDWEFNLILPVQVCKVLTIVNLCSSQQRLGKKKNLRIFAILREKTMDLIFMLLFMYMVFKICISNI